MQFKIPQDVQREDTIIAFLTLRHLIILSIGGAVAYGVYTGLARVYILSVALPPTIVIAVITLAFAFLNIGGVPFHKFLLLLVEHYILVPAKRVWQKGKADPGFSILQTKIKTKEEKMSEQKQYEDEERKQKLKKVIEMMNLKKNNQQK